MKNHRKILIAIIMAIAILTNPIISTAAAIYNINRVPESQPITIDGYSNESAWENSIFIKENLPSRNTNFTKYIILRVLIDVDYLYVQAYVMDNDRATKDGKPDNVRLIMKQGNYTKDFIISHTGKALSGGGISAGDDSDINYVIEARIPFQKKWTASGEFTLSATVTDNGTNSAGEILSDVRSFSYLFKVNIDVPTTKPTTTTTTKSNTTTNPIQPPITNPTSGSGNSTGGNGGGIFGGNNGSDSYTPPAGETSEGETTPSGEQITAGQGGTDGMTTTGEFIEGTTELPTSGNISILGNNWILIASLVIVAILVGILLYVAWSVRKRVAKKKK